jgi:hypothetical protein
LFIIKDATQDDRFSENPFVTGPLNLRFYAGCPLDVPIPGGGGSVNIGTLCLLDRKPRTLSSAQKKKLTDYADMITKEILNRDADLAESITGRTTSGSVTASDAS